MGRSLSTPDLAEKKITLALKAKEPSRKGKNGFSMTLCLSAFSPVPNQIYLTHLLRLNFCFIKTHRGISKQIKN